MLVYAVIITIIPYCIFIPLSILYTWKYFTLRYYIEISKRYANIVILQSIFATILMLCAMAVLLENAQIIHFSVFHPFISAVYGLVYCLLSRLWLYYFDIKYDQTVHQNEWEYILNEQFDHIEQNLQLDTTNFFVKYKSYLGRKTFVGKLAVFMWFISTLIPFCLWYDILTHTQV